MAASSRSIRTCKCATPSCTSPQHDCKWRGLPARATPARAHHLHAYEPPVEERGARPGLRPVATATNRAPQAGGGVAGRQRRQGPFEPASVQCHPVRRSSMTVSGGGCPPGQRPPGHTIYTRMNRRSKNGVLDRVFDRLQRQHDRAPQAGGSVAGRQSRQGPSRRGGGLKKPFPVSQVPRRLDQRA